LSLKIFVCFLVVAVNQMISPWIHDTNVTLSQLTHFLQHLRILLFVQPDFALAFLLSSDVRPLTEDKYISNVVYPFRRCQRLTCQCISNFGDFVEMLGIWETQSSHTKRMPRLLEVTIERFPGMAKQVTTPSVGIQSDRENVQSSPPHVDII
jgi:hypothetical protein